MTKLLPELAPLPGGLVPDGERVTFRHGLPLRGVGQQREQG